MLFAAGFPLPFADTLTSGYFKTSLTTLDSLEDMVESELVCVFMESVSDSGCCSFSYSSYRGSCTSYPSLNLFFKKGVLLCTKTSITNI